MLMSIDVYRSVSENRWITTEFCLMITELKTPRSTQNENPHLHPSAKKDTPSASCLIVQMTTTANSTAQLLCTKQGGPFNIVHAPKPALASDEVLVKQRVIALNGVDAKQRDLGIAVPHWPRLLGIEGAGVIEAVASDVRSLRPGDEVAGWEGGGAHVNSWGGAFQERVAVPAYFLFKRPKNISLVEAASLP